MAEKKQETTVQPNEAPQARPCPQDCRVCGMSQQVFCSTKMLFDMSRTMQVLGQQIAEVEKAVADLQVQMQKSESPEQLAIPFPNDIAQNG